MLELDKLKTFIENLLEFKGVCKECEKDQPLWQHLYHLYLSAAIFTQMSEDEKKTAQELQKRLSSYFARINVKIKQKKRKRKDEKEKISPTPPLIKEKEEKEKDEETTHTVGRNFSSVSEDLTNRRNIFHQQCLSRIEKYGTEAVKDFYNYWSEEDSKSGKMRFEFQKTWNIDRRLARWVNSGYAADDKAARIRLRNAKQRQEKDTDTLHQQQGMNAEREDANAKLEREIAERKQGAVSYEEYLKMKEQKQK